MPVAQSIKKQGEETRKKILEAGLKLWPNVTPATIAKELSITHALVIYHFKNVKLAVANYAVESGNSKVIAQLIASGHISVEEMSDEERRKHLLAVMG